MPCKKHRSSDLEQLLQARLGSKYIYLKTFVEVNITLGAFNIFFMEIITDFCTDPEVEQLLFYSSGRYH